MSDLRDLRRIDFPTARLSWVVLRNNLGAVVEMQWRNCINVLSAYFDAGEEAVNPRAMKLALEAWVAYDAALTLHVQRDGGTVGWTGRVEPELERLYERALVLMRVTLGLHMGALGEGTLSPAEVEAIAAEARGA